MRHHVLSLCLAACVAGAVTFLVPQAMDAATPPETHEAGKPVKETAFERVMRTGVIRCGSDSWAPMLMRDEKTGKMSGTWFDVTEALGRALGLRIDWAHETNTETFLQELNEGVYDMDCGGGWSNALRGKLAQYSTPAFYFPVYPIVRGDDTRFDGHYDYIDAPAIRVTVMKGENSEVLRHRYYPQSGIYPVSPDAPFAEMAVSVIANKADVTFLSTAELEAYLVDHPGTLKAAKGSPLRLIPQNYAVAMNETRLRNMIDIALQELLNDGTIEAIIKQHEVVPGTYLRAAIPYAPLTQWPGPAAVKN